MRNLFLVSLLTAMATGCGEASIPGHDIPLASVQSDLTATWSPAGSMAAARSNHVAVRLPNGKVLVAGGVAGLNILASAEIYDPATNIWAPAASMRTARYVFVAALLPNGKVLVAGGAGTSA